MCHSSILIWISAGKSYSGHSSERSLGKYPLPRRYPSHLGPSDTYFVTVVQFSHGDTTAYQSEWNYVGNMQTNINKH